MSTLFKNRRRSTWKRWVRRSLLTATLSLAVLPCGTLFAQQNAQSNPNASEVANQNHVRGTSGNPSVSHEMRAVLMQKGDLLFPDRPLSDALLAIQKEWGVNIVVSDEVEGRVSGAFQETPLYEILDSLLTSRGYSYQVKGRTITIMATDRVGAVKPLFAPTVIPLAALDPNEAVTVVQDLLSPDGNVTAVQSAHAIMVVDMPNRVEWIKSQLNRLEQAAALRAQALRATQNTANTPTGVDGDPGFQPPIANAQDVVYFAPQYIRSEAIGEAVQAMLSDQGRYSIVASENRLVVVDYPEVIKLVERLVEEMDVPRPQVRITSRIYDVSMKDLERLGINWNQTHNARFVGDDPQTIIDLNSITHAVVGGTTNGALTLTNMSRYFDLEAVINALNTADDSRLLADPSVTVQNHDSARIRIVTEIPYQELTETDAGGAIGTTSFREAGVTLEVTPTVADDQTVHMVLTPSFSRLAGFTEGASPQPIIDQREATTSLRVPNRQTVVIGGLRQRSDVNKFAGIPRLKDVTTFGIGRLFKSYDSTVQESELVVFVTPEILVPNYSGLPRESNANALTEHLLDRVPAANLDPGACYGANSLNETIISEEVHEPYPDYPQQLVPQDVHEPAPESYIDPAAPTPQQTPTETSTPVDGSEQEVVLPEPVVDHTASRDFDAERRKFWKKSVQRRPGPIESYGEQRRNPNIAWMMPRDGSWVMKKDEEAAAKADVILEPVPRVPEQPLLPPQQDTSQQVAPEVARKITRLPKPSPRVNRAGGPLFVEPSVQQISNTSPYQRVGLVEAKTDSGLWLNAIFGR